MLRALLISTAFIAASLHACARRSSDPESERAFVPMVSEASCHEPKGLNGVVVHDPHFHTLVRPPHAGTFVAPSAKVGDRVAPRAPLAEIVWGPNRGKILAPVGGVVVHAGAAIGSYLRDTDAPFVIADPARLAVRIDEAPPAIRRAAALQLEIDGVEQPLVGHGAVGDGGALFVALPPGFDGKIGAGVRVSLNCS